MVFINPNVCSKLSHDNIQVGRRMCCSNTIRSNNFDDMIILLHQFVFVIVYV